MTGNDVRSPQVGYGGNEPDGHASFAHAKVLADRRFLGVDRATDAPAQQEHQEMTEINWTEEQRARLQDAIDAEIENSRLADKIIRAVPVPANDRAVARDRYIYPNPGAAPPVIEGIDETFVDLGADNQEAFSLTKLQTEDPDLSRALVRVRRATQQLARSHDTSVFRVAIRDELDREAPGPGAPSVPGYHNIVAICEDVRGSGRYGDGLATAAAEAVAELDGEGYRSGFVMVAGQAVFRQLHQRVPGAADLPVVAVRALLDDGPIHRSAVLPQDEALVLSISGEEVDRAVAVGPTLEFLRVGANENREFRVYERFLTRFKQTYAAVLLRLAPAPAPAPAGP